MSELRHAALDYARRWGVAGAGALPLCGKVPVEPATGRAMRGWQRRASADPDTILGWWSGRDWNVGVAPRGAFVALDVDRRRGDDNVLHGLERRLGELPETPTYETSDGWRVLLASPGMRLRSELEGIKVNCERGQIVMPPSVHPETGVVYTWECEREPDDVPLAPLPETWLAELRDESVRHLRAVPDPGEDFLDTRPPAEYVRLSANVRAEPGAKIRCPLPGHEDRTPSFHVYESAEGGWFCFGCGRGGGIYQLAAFLAGLKLPLRGTDFLAVESALYEVYSEAFGDPTLAVVG